MNDQKAACHRPPGGDGAPMTLGGDADGAPSGSESYAEKFSGRCAHRIIEGVGHNVRQEAAPGIRESVFDVYTY